MNPPPPRPWYLREYIFGSIIFVPPGLIGGIIAEFTDGGWIPLISAIVIICITANVMVNAWHRHCARHGHRQDL